MSKINFEELGRNIILNLLTEYKSREEYSDLIDDFYSKWNLSNSNDFDKLIWSLSDKYGNWDTSGMSMSTYFLPTFLKDNLGDPNPIRGTRSELSRKLQVRFSNHQHKHEGPSYDLKDLFNLFDNIGISGIQKLHKKIDSEVKDWWKKNRKDALAYWEEYDGEPFDSKYYDESELMDIYIDNDDKVLEELQDLIDIEFYKALK